jgi:hypothetical protein
VSIGYKDDMREIGRREWIYMDMRLDRDGNVSGRLDGG